MKFTVLTILALGASTSAYVVPNTKVAVEDKAVNAARMPVSSSYFHIMAISF
ncbi:hypothetical protein P153DRAFT_368205 [Dothidotthia symphoricarpi CBS 119687]|uniref:Uncharacterized protein n=1 Tax=Dothidotthia symphoricarpi CBS 119687 TaxID=1392245 RepID=A0A6A6A7T4_9PLEO|nr:uncharacterized protein P153DRAFT_368205 [Dothidotthia symphoricarpi CBS 119687]KAF2127616.1 hypothetical protein P153DRAFT_368205 [Dothidotthia symphoricarpi CBS 119687]